MAQIKKRKTIRKSIRIGGAISQKTFSDPGDAAEWYADQLRRKQRSLAGLDEPITPNLITVREWSAIVMRKRAGGSVVAGTWRNDGARLQDYIHPLVGDRIFQSVKTHEWEKVLDLIQDDPRKIVSMRMREMRTPEDREKFEKKIKRHKLKLSNTTRNLIRALLHTVYEEAIKEGIVFSNPIGRVPVKDQGDPEDKIDFWETEDECKRYLSEHLQYGRQIQNYSWYAWATWSLGKGPRVNELIALTHADVDLGSRRVRIKKIYDPHVKAIVDRTKGSRRSKRGGRKRSARWLLLNEPMMEAYKLLWAATPFKKPTDRVFLNTRDPKFNHIKSQSNILTVSGITNIHRQICERAKIRVIRVHDLRHTFGAHFVMNGGSLSTLAEILGHSHTWVTERYSHLSESHLERETDRVRFDINLTNNVVAMTPGSGPQNGTERDA